MKGGGSRNLCVSRRVLVLATQMRKRWFLCAGKVGRGGGGQDNNDGNREQEQVQGSGRHQDDGDGGGEMQESYVEIKNSGKTRKASREFDVRVGDFQRIRSYKDSLCSSSVSLDEPARTGSGWRG